MTTNNILAYYQTKPHRSEGAAEQTKTRYIKAPRLLCRSAEHWEMDGEAGAWQTPQL